MIPDDIQDKHINAAMDQIDQNGVPAGRDGRKFYVQRNSHKYPPKYVVALACKAATGEFLDSQLFNGGKETNSFLRKLGFLVGRYGSDEVETRSSPRPKPLPAARRTKAPAAATRHSERCPDCKDTVEKMLEKLYVKVKRNPRLNAHATVEGYKGTPAYDALLRIHSALQRQRGFTQFVSCKTLPNCDFLVPNPSFLVEFDESQHFTKSRKLALSMYPDDIPFGFDRRSWMALCDETNARDNEPPYRDEQRAWYDTLRDLVPQVLGMLPTVRLYSKEFVWCKLDPANPIDVDTFRHIVGGRTNFWTLDYRVPSHDATLGRLTNDGPWDGNVALARKLLQDVAQNWPPALHLDCLSTCGAFLVFEWPDPIPRQRDNRYPDASAIQELNRLGQKCCEQLLSGGLRKKLARCTDYLTIGVDTKKAKISSTDNHIPQPHAEFVFVADLRTGELHFTGKSYPTPQQERGLLRVEDLDTHFVKMGDKETMVLGCHDLNIFNPRSDATAKGWRAEVKEQFKALAHRHKPVQVLHHPHTAVIQMTWKHAWNGLLEELPSVQSYLGTGCYTYRDSRNGLNRDSLESVLVATGTQSDPGVVDVVVRRGRL